MKDRKRDVHTIDIVSSEVYDILKVAASNENKSLRSFVNDLLSDSAKSREFFNSKFDYLTKLKSDNPNKVKIADDKKKSIAEVSMIDGKLQCSVCEKNLVCDHVTYSMVNPDFWKMLQDDKDR